MGTNTANGLEAAATAVMTRATPNGTYSARRSDFATDPSTRNRLPTAMSSPWELRATAIANAQPQIPSEIRKSARHTAAATA